MKTTSETQALLVNAGMKYLDEHRTKYMNYLGKTQRGAEWKEGELPFAPGYLSIELKTNKFRYWTKWNAGTVAYNKANHIVYCFAYQKHTLWLNLYERYKMIKGEIKAIGTRGN